MICSKCKCVNEDDAKFCKECGNKLEQIGTCPVCSAPINGEKYCPQCGVKIDVRGIDNNENKKQKVNRIINLVTNIISIVVFALIMVFVWLPVLNVNGSDFGDPIYTILLQWKNLNFTDLNGYEVTSKLIYAIAPCLIIISNIGATYLFAIRGIVKSSKSIIDKKEFVSIPSMLVVFISNVITYAILRSFVSSGYVFDSVEDTLTILSQQGSGSALVLGFSGVFIVAFASYRIYLSFNKNMVSIFVEKILFTLSCLLAIGLLLNTSGGPLALHEANTYNVQYGTFLLMLNEYVKLGLSPNNPLFYTNFALIILSFTFELFILVTVSGFTYLMFMSLFKGDQLSFKFKKPILVGAIITSAITLINVILSIVICAIYSNLYSIPAENILNGEGVIASFIMSIYILGVSVAGYIISLRFKRAVEEDKIEVKN